ncbi:MAG: UspA [Deltaproteobacteria bacterium]|jgi:nucleotide-binding universal stress UspA family protein|nr:UspA [Deltaproteobacteria bacterium]
MIPRIKKILYATDLSENSAYAFRYAVNSAQQHGAKIHILHVLEEIKTNILAAYYELEKLQEIREKGKEEVKDRIQKRLETFCQKELMKDPECRDLVASTEVVEGDPAAEILRKADELGVDLVVMGTHGKGLLEHAFLGSVAEKILHRIKIPVLTIPIPKETDIRLSV